jgi:hypothetical protein
MVACDESLGLNDDALKKLSKSAGASRTHERNTRIAELEAKYPDHWGKRSGAKFIAARETEDGSPTSERTVRGYFRS